MMGYDYIICEYPLPVSEAEEEMGDIPNWGEVEFQTKAFVQENSGGMMDKYTIEEDGQIFLEKINREWASEEKTGRLYIKETPDGIEKQSYTGELSFYGMHMDKKYDFFLEFKALCWKGELKEITLDDYKKEDNEGRKEALKNMEQQILEAEKKSKNLFSKIMAGPRFIVLFFTGLIRYVLGLIVRFTWKLERWVS